MERKKREKHAAPWQPQCGTDTLHMQPPSPSRLGEQCDWEAVPGIMHEPALHNPLAPRRAREKLGTSENPDDSEMLTPPALDLR